jgi:ectoine hydroxylase-related dioxygenase (phytanoyl-CoA dioxygenase family)
MSETLDARQVARFVADGMLRWDAIVPEELNRAVLAEIEGGKLGGCPYNNDRHDLDAFLADAPAYQAVIGLPQVQAAIRTLVGPDPNPDHFCVHTVGPRSGGGQIWHADATIDARTEAFDIQIFYFPHDTPRESGGTIFLPSSHFRRVHEFQINRYQNIVGQTPTVCPAGTILVGHHNLWHGGQPNRTDRTRYMIKLRLNPTVRQRGLFDHRSADPAEIGHILSTHHRWHGVEARIEILQRLRLWRAITGTDYDWDLWLSRLECSPTREASDLLVGATA